MTQSTGPRVTRGFGIVGAGVIAAMHADAIASLPGTRLTAITDMDTAAAAAFAAVHGGEAGVAGELSTSIVRVFSFFLPPGEPPERHASK